MGTYLMGDVTRLDQFLDRENELRFESLVHELLPVHLLLYFHSLFNALMFMC